MSNERALRRARPLRRVRAESAGWFERLESERLAGENSITLVDYGPASSSLSSAQLDILSVQSQELLDNADLEIIFERVNCNMEARLKPGRLIGVTRYSSANRYVDVVVEPRIGNARFLKMLETANGALNTREQTPDVYEDAHDPAAVVVEFAVDQILGFLRRYSYRDYCLRHEDGTTTPRGRLDVRQYVNRSMTTFKWDKMPCTYFELSPNVIENQILMSALAIAGRLAARFPVSMKNRVTRKIAIARRALFGVDELRLSEQDVSSLQYTGRNEKFETVHRYCFLLLFNSTVSLSPGRHIPFSSFTLSMSDLFERYIRAVLQSIYTRAAFPPKRALVYPIGDEGEIRLDGLIKSQGKSTIVECKYKMVEDYKTGVFDESSMLSADIYQVIAYATHKDVQAAKGVIVYPSMRSDAAPVEKVHEYKSFVGVNPIDVQVVLVNLERSADEHRSGFRSLLTPAPSPHQASAAT